MNNLCWQAGETGVVKKLYEVDTRVYISGSVLFGLAFWVQIYWVLRSHSVLMNMNQATWGPFY